MAFVVEEKDSEMAVIIRKDSSLHPDCFESYKEEQELVEAPIEIEEEKLEDEEEDQEELPTCYDMYLKTMDEGFLKFHEGQLPTRFVMRRVIDWKTSQRLKDATMTVSKGRKIDYKAASSFMREIRACLIDIQHPEGIDPGKVVFKQERDGLASLELMSLLDSYGIIDNLYEARTKFLKDPAALKKK